MQENDFMRIENSVNRDNCGKARDVEQLLSWRTSNPSYKVILVFNPQTDIKSIIYFFCFS